jgi:hypothetical protein
MTTTTRIVLGIGTALAIAAYGQVYHLDYVTDVLLPAQTALAAEHGGGGSSGTDHGGGARPDQGGGSTGGSHTPDHEDSSHETGDDHEGGSHPGGSTDSHESEDGHEEASHEPSKGGSVDHGSRGGGPPQSGTLIEDKVLRGRGGSPPWTGGEVSGDSLGRLNVARAPSQVLDRAKDEAYAEFLDLNGDGIVDSGADLTSVHSPAANVALYAEAIAEGTWTLEQAAVFLGNAASSHAPITLETVEQINLILGVGDNLTAEQVARLASDAEKARLAAGESHDDS